MIILADEPESDSDKKIGSYALRQFAASNTVQLARKHGIADVLAIWWHWGHHGLWVQALQDAVTERQTRRFTHKLLLRSMV